MQERTTIHEISYPVNVVSAAKAPDKIVPVVFCADANYGLYLPVAVQSIIDNASSGYHYRIIILDCGIADEVIEALAHRLTLYDNFSLQVKNIEERLKNYNHNFEEKRHLTRAMYGRFFIPDLCCEYEKVIYADIDMVFNRNIAKLLNIDLGENYIAGALDTVLEIERVFRKKCASYMTDILALRSDEIYINSGLLVFNIKAWQEKGLSRQCIDFLTGRQIEYPDQDAINSICKSKILYLEQGWNYLRWGIKHIEGRKAQIEAAKAPYLKQIVNSWAEASSQPPAVFYYNGATKPWHFFDVSLADKWWDYAAKTPFYGRYLTDLAVKSAQRRHMELLSEECLSSDKIYKFLGIPFWAARAIARKKKYYIGPVRIAKKVYGRENIYLYILGLKLFGIRRKKG